MGVLKTFEQDLAYHFSEVLDIPFAKPEWVYVSLSHKCTYNCRMCGVVKILKGYELSSELVRKALEEISSWGWGSNVVFTGGEPFLRKDILDLADYAASLGLRIKTVSNGSLINEDLAGRIIASGLSNIAVSLDGSRAGTHDFFRGKGAFEAALRAIRLLSSAKKQRGKGPQISVWCTIMKENIGELSEMVELVGSAGCECLVFHPVIVGQDDMQNTCNQAPFWPGREEIALLQDQVKLISRDSGYNGIVAFLHDPLLWLRHFEGTLRKSDWKCNPFAFINIGPDGEVRSCGDSFGNIQESGIGGCLSSAQAFAARNKMKECRKPCLQTCWAHPQADHLNSIVERLIRDSALTPERREVLRQAVSGLDKYRDMVSARIGGDKRRRTSV